MSMLDHAWDHDDAFECSRDQVPIKIRVETYHSYAMDQWPARYQDLDRHNHSSSVLRRECERYFNDHPGCSFEIEDIVCLLRQVESSVATFGLEPQSDKESLVEGWYALYGYETTRWLLLAMALALGYNFSSVQVLPGGFEVLLQSPNCYIS